ncbi:MAG: NAD-dependent epimerase/dehydratase family protein, partial [Bacillota bacterium]
TSELLKRNYSVVVLDNLSSGKRENLKGVINNFSFSFVEGDIRSKDKLNEAFQGADSIIHLAALVDITASVTDPFSTNDVNVNGMLNVLQEAVRQKAERLVFASSTAVYGDAKTSPIKEEATVNPISPYAASKLAGEAYCKAYEKSYGLSTIVLRFFNVYGPRSQSNAYSGVITKFLQQAKNGNPLNIYGDGEQTRDFIHVRDIVEALIRALETKEVNSETFNVCTGIPTSINKLAQAVQVATKKDLQTIYAPARLGEIKFSYGDGSKAQKKLGFKAKISLLEGLNSLIDH